MPINQFIVSDLEAASLCSDNLDALQASYNRLKPDRERDRFANALMDRLNVDKGYLEIAYFAVGVMQVSPLFAAHSQNIDRDVSPGADEC